MKKPKEITLKILAKIHSIKFLLIIFFVLPPLVVFYLILSMFKKLEIKAKR